LVSNNILETCNPAKSFVNTLSEVFLKVRIAGVAGTVPSSQLEALFQFVVAGVALHVDELEPGTPNDSNEFALSKVLPAEEIT
jgi:hypothetical protein